MPRAGHCPVLMPRPGHKKVPRPGHKNLPRGLTKVLRPGHNTPTRAQKLAPGSQKEGAPTGAQKLAPGSQKGAPTGGKLSTSSTTKLLDDGGILRESRKFSSASNNNTAFLFSCLDSITEQRIQNKKNSKRQYDNSNNT